MPHQKAEIYISVPPKSRERKVEALVGKNEDAQNEEDKRGHEETKKKKPMWKKNDACIGRSSRVKNFYIYTYVHKKKLHRPVNTVS